MLNVRTSCLIATAAIAGVVGVGACSVPSSGPVEEREAETRALALVVAADPVDTPTYLATCKSKGVDTPPDFPAPPWTLNGNLANGPNPPPGGTQLWTWTSANGTVCSALPSFNNDNPPKIDLMGIICYNPKNGNTCFLESTFADGPLALNPNKPYPRRRPGRC